MLKHVAFIAELSQEYFYYDEVLLIDAALPATRIMEILRVYLGGDETGN